MMQRLHANAPQLIALLVTATLLLSLWGATNLLVRGVLVVLLLALPGALLVAALFGGQRLGGAERILYVLVSSIAVLALGGLLLNLTPWGLDSLPFAALLGVILAGAALLASRRRSQVKKGDLEPLTRPEPLNLAQASLFGLSAVIVGLALTIARSPAPADNYAGYSLLSLLPAPAASAAAWQIRVESQEFSPTTYSLVVTLDEEVVFAAPDFTLAPHGQWQTQVDLSTYARTDGELEARLYRSDDPGVVYRQVLVREARRNGGN